MNVKRTSIIAAAVLSVAIPGSLAAQERLDAAALERWLDGYEAAWEARDAEAASRLFTAGARYYETPYSEPFVGRDGIREYWATVTEDQRDVEFEYDVVAVDGETGVARWNAVFAAGPDGTRVELDGVFVLAFDADGLCSELREWWHMR